MSTTVTSRGQVTIPKRVRDLFGLVPGSSVDFEVSSEGQVTLRRIGRPSKRRQSRFEKLRGEIEDIRIICFGLLEERMVVVGYVPRGASRHIFSMRKANGREQERLAPYFEI